MSKAYPSMAALLGLIAIAGYQHRDKISEWIQGHSAQNPQSPPPGVQTRGPLDNILGNVRSALGAGGAGAFLTNGLRELVDHFSQNGKADVAHSWVNRGPNKTITPQELESTIGADVLADLAQRTGLARDELLARLSRELPAAVDMYTPDGRIPAA